MPNHSSAAPACCWAFLAARTAHRAASLPSTRCTVGHLGAPIDHHASGSRLLTPTLTSAAPPPAAGYCSYRWAGTYAVVELDTFRGSQDTRAPDRSPVKLPLRKVGLEV
jgi:hypothetical protein